MKLQTLWLVKIKREDLRPIEIIKGDSILVPRVFMGPNVGYKEGTDPLGALMERASPSPTQVHPDLVQALGLLI